LGEAGLVAHLNRPYIDFLLVKGNFLLYI